MKTLIITNSYDATSDILINYIGSHNIFRLNFDRYFETSIKIDSNGIKLKVGENEISDKDIIKVLWRKPFNIDLDIDNFLKSELKYIFREIYNFFHKQNKTILILPNIERYKGKIVQLFTAKQYFNVPNWSIKLNYRLNNGLCVVKSLSSELTNENKVLYTTKIQVELLDEKYPWYIQDFIEAKYDVTVVFINGKLFAYELERKDNLVDWRKEINIEKQNWLVHNLEKGIQEKILMYMNELGLKFGRLDFLYDNGKYYFLEVNPNGQWAWLDLENKNGLMEEMILQVSPLTNVITRP
jgi:hypothetical protein